MKVYEILPNVAEIIQDVPCICLPVSQKMWELVIANLKRNIKGGSIIGIEILINAGWTNNTKITFYELHPEKGENGEVLFYEVYISYSGKEWATGSYFLKAL